MVGAQLVDEPARVRELRLGEVERGAVELLALALEAAQHRVDEAAGVARTEQPRRIDGRRYRRVRRDAQLLQL